MWRGGSTTPGARAVGCVALGLLIAGCVEPAPPTEPTPEPSCTEAPGEICTVAGTGDRGFNGTKPALETFLYLPSDVRFDAHGQMHVVDFNNMVIRRLEADGTLPPIAGVGLHAYASDGIEALQSPLENPNALAVAPDGSLFIIELHGTRVLRVDPEGWLTVYAGSPDSPGYEGYEGDGGPAREAALTESYGLCLGDDGTLFIADTGNHAIRAVTPDGTIDTLAGDGTPGHTDGIGAGAQLDGPRHLACHDGTVYVADMNNHRVRAIDAATGAVSTLAGTGEPGHSGDGGPALSAMLSEPYGVAVGEDGTVFVAEFGNHTVRAIRPDGTIETVAGQPGEAGSDGDLGPATDAWLSRPQQVGVWGDDLYIVDTFNDVIRRVTGGAAAP